MGIFSPKLLCSVSRRPDEALFYDESYNPALFSVLSVSYLFLAKLIFTFFSAKRSPPPPLH